ncbi:hypothetical protein EJ04DRAFT_582175 [Polyplosphaeria fusca]|uniref:Integral membrane protein n=1 Tax=Polyplosphaeria fusca TaxID=682080 RepID=A0A9P4QH76_9PLEO|nr:hypothetical protein EJ04DRAFT_582175 [Polyplosphaeria fusca]
MADRPTTVSTATTTTQGPRITTTTTTTTRSSTGPHTTVSTHGPQSTTVQHPTITTRHELPLPPPLPRPSSSAATQTERQPSIRIRRHAANSATQTSDERVQATNRRQSSSEPQSQPQPQPQPQDDMEIRRQQTATPLQTLAEEPSTESGEAPQLLDVPQRHPSQRLRRPGFHRQISAISLRSNRRAVPEYEAEFVNVLDVIDPEVATLTTLNNVQNSLFIPNLGSFYRRQPTYNLSQSPPDVSDEENGHVVPDLDEHCEPSEAEGEGADKADGREGQERPEFGRMKTISSVLTGMSEGHNYAVLPHGTSLPGWTAEEKAALNDHVRHLLHSRRAKFKRGMRGFGHYVRKPVGFLVTLYATLLTFWGAAWVLFLIGWISVGDRQAYFIEICDQILTALFCVVGIGLSPWRAIDTYHMIPLAYYAHRTWRLRKERGLPKLKDRNELPSRPLTHAWEKGEEDEVESEEIVLEPAEQTKLEHHQGKLSSSHTFYRPHETTTHHAFSVRLLIAIVVLLDFHSMFQMALGGTTWGIYYKDRPKALTAVILSCSISCNISAGILISIGDRRSRKRLVVEQIFRQGVTEDALKELRKKRGLKAKGPRHDRSNQDDIRAGNNARTFMNEPHHIS